VVYREFAEYLEEGRRRSPSITQWFILFATLPIFAAARSPRHALWFGIAGFVGFIALAVIRSQQQRRSRTEYGTWLDTLRRFKDNGQLDSRSHPDLIESLEACATLRKEIDRTLHSDGWKRLAAAQGWGDIADLCREAADSLLRDAVWAAKPLFRGFGARRDSFAKRCADTTFYALPMAAVRLARTKLERLLDEVSDYPFASLRSTDALARAQLEMKALRDAEREIHGLG
jgi:hypothetical protein